MIRILTEGAVFSAKETKLLTYLVQTKKDPKAMFTTTTKDLKKAIAEAWPVINRSNHIPILGHFLLDLGPEPTITATNLDQSIRVDFYGANNTLKRFKVCLPAQALKNIISKLDDGEITICKDIGGVIIQSGNLKAQLNSLPVEDFPVMNKPEKPFKFGLDCQVFHKLFNKTNPFISTEDTRYYLNGVFMAQQEDKLIAATTDGHRLGKVSIPLPSGLKGMPNVIIPRLAAILAERFSKSKEAAPVGIEVTDMGVVFYFEGVKLQTKVIDGTFPDINRVIPKPDGETSALFNTRELLEVVKRLFAFKTERTQGLRLGMSKSEALLSYTSPEIGRVSEKVATVFGGLPFEIGFNSAYLITLLNNIGSEYVRFSFEPKGHGPVLIEDLGDKESVFVLMPMRV